MSSVTKRIGDREVECFEAGNTGKMLFQLSGVFGGDVVRNTFMLVPMTMEEPQLQQMSDMWLSVQEAKLGLLIGKSCTSSGWRAGTNETKALDKVTDEYDYLVSAVEHRNIVADCILISGVQDGTFYTVQKHIREKESESFYSLYMMDAEPDSMDLASIEAFYMDRGGSVVGSWAQIMAAFRDFMNWPDSLRDPAAEKPGLDSIITCAEQCRSTSDSNANKANTKELIEH